MDGWMDGWTGDEEYLGKDPAGVLVRSIEEVGDDTGILFVSVGREILPGEPCVVGARLRGEQTNKAQHRSVNPERLLHLRLVCPHEILFLPSNVGICRVTDCSLPSPWKLWPAFLINRISRPSVRLVSLPWRNGHTSFDP